jgi:hypothetical protein
MLPKNNIKGYIKCLFLDLIKITGNAFLLLVEWHRKYAPTSR